MAFHVTYTFAPETLDDLELIMESRPGMTKSALMRSLIAAEAARIRQAAQATR